MAIATQLRGVPEWTPSTELLESELTATIRRAFELHGFQPIDTAVLVPLDALKTGGAQYSDGGVAKPVFRVGEEDGADADEELALRYDLTVPLARYLASQAEVTYPLHCYQIGKVWRAGEVDPTHWREFYQCDIDVIGQGELGLAADAEVAVAMSAAFEEIGVRGFNVHFSHRSILGGLLTAHGLDTTRSSQVVAIIDDAGRQPSHATGGLLVEAGLPADVAQVVVGLLECHTIDDTRQYLAAHGAATDGADELGQVLELAAGAGLPASRTVIDHSITRGHDYYTGTVFETFAAEREHWGAIGSGGRYSSLLGHFLGAPHPGVGLSIGLTRLVALMGNDAEAVPQPPRVADVLVADGATPIAPGTNELAGRLRREGIRVRVLCEPRTRRQALAYADQVGIGVVVLAAPSTEEFEVVVANGEVHRLDRDATVRLVGGMVGAPGRARR